MKPSCYIGFLLSVMQFEERVGRKSEISGVEMTFAGEAWPLLAKAQGQT